MTVGSPHGAPRLTGGGSLRRHRRALGWTAAGLAAAVLLFALPVPYVRLAPGPMFNTIGDLDGTPLITISGTEVYPVTGELNMTTVSESGGPTGYLIVGDALLGWLNPDTAVVPRSQMYPADLTAQQVRARNRAAFSGSQSDAIAAALGYLTIDARPTVIVRSLQVGGPADGPLEPGDRVLAVDDRPTTTPADVVAAVRDRAIGDSVTVRVQRGDETVEEVLTTIAATPTRADGTVDPQARPVPIIGAAIGVAVDPPFDIDFEIDRVGGPSAGLMFTLGIVDKLTPGSLTGGLRIAGTGTISPDGSVGPVGGVRHKIAAARDRGAALFLVPRDNCEDATTVSPGAMRLIVVDSLAAAVAAIEEYRADTGSGSDPGSATDPHSGPASGGSPGTPLRCPPASA